MRRKTKVVKCGNVYIGGDNPITVQSMTTTNPMDFTNTVKEIEKLENAGCDILRIAVSDMGAAKSISKIKQHTEMPVVADIHFDYRLALQSIEEGVDKLRLNPGNIGGAAKVREVVKAAKQKGIPIRIGVNAGSLEESILDKYGYPTAEGMVESALKHIAILEDLDFTDIVVSLKASDVRLTVDAYKLMAEKVDYPFHLGITEAGTVWTGTIKSSAGIGALLLMGIGDTIRVSLTGDPVEEVRAGRQLLKSLGIIQNEITIISCPTCGRCKIDLVRIANQVEERLGKLKKPIKVAIMGCAVNGPGEARDADIGIAGGAGSALLFKKGQIIRKIKEDEILKVLVEEIKKM
ncbi:MAG TPA: flavodoxin-dependent (E)-4-hydroxy-3-methylbut-2-enyl-diphosphate synthase [Clostridia bacterium]|nr:flavodoxin-dependent (E)-4-hydroxy-3-methylbut-2-enyl-diphosphate synthase [Clostridia bacterium]